MSSATSSSPSTLLGPDGPLAGAIAGFAPRAQQQAMAEAVLAAIREKDVLVAEAGTGTGKTFAYLVPAILSGRKVILSTGTRNLQDQLYHRDLPAVRDALGRPVEIALLKGRANYLCRHRLELAVGEGRYRSRAEADKVMRIRDWAGVTHRGDIAECVAVPENDPVWPLVTSTSDNCAGSECAHFDDCHLTRARRAAQAADIVVINHYLLFADMALRDEGFGELLPAADAFVIDEAHQIPEVASAFFGLAVSSNQLLELAGDATTEYLRDINEDAAFAGVCERLKKAAQDLRLAFGRTQRRGAWKELEQQRDFATLRDNLTAALGALHGALRPMAERSKGLAQCAARAADLEGRFAQVFDAAPEGFIHWFDVHRRSVSFHLTPMNIAEPFRAQMEELGGAWIFTSATLTVDHSFRHFNAGLGLEDPRCESWESPFDFSHQALLYLPRIEAEPNAPHYTGEVIAVARRLIELAQGSTFLLFTSHRALREAAAELNGLDYPVLVQGDAPRDVLLARFREHGHAVLLGTSSFWEGVDVRGDALTCVLIDKLPFASPGDPVLQARINAMRKAGGNPFMEYQLPNAVITLKQGAGRLIRDVTDYGVLALCDPRLRGKAYGRIFLDSLPAMPHTDDIRRVAEFLRLNRRPERGGDAASLSA